MPGSRTAPMVMLLPNAGRQSPPIPGGGVLLRRTGSVPPPVAFLLALVCSALRLLTLEYAGG